MVLYGCKPWSDFSGLKGNPIQISHSWTSFWLLQDFLYLCKNTYSPFFCRGRKERSLWYFVHWMLGTVISLGVIINIYTGINVYIKKTSRSATLWTILFTAEVSVIAFLYLLQDKWEYLQKQGVILGNVPITLPNREIPERLNQKELFLEPCGKVNALQNLFDWYGILYYPFSFRFCSFELCFLMSALYGSGRWFHKRLH